MQYQGERKWRGNNEVAKKNQVIGTLICERTA